MIVDDAGTGVRVSSRLTPPIQKKRKPLPAVADLRAIQLKTASSPSSYFHPVIQLGFGQQIENFRFKVSTTRSNETLSADYADYADAEDRGQWQ